MRSRHNAEAASAVARRMAAVSAELAALRPAQAPEAPGGRPGSLPPAAPQQPAESAESVEDPVGRTHVRDDRWARWWPDAPEDEDEEPYTVAGGTGSVPAGRHSRRGRVPASASSRTVLRTRVPELAPSHLVLLSLLLTCAVAVTAWWVVRSQPQVIEPTTAPPVVTASGMAPGVGEPTAGGPSGSVTGPSGAGSEAAGTGQQSAVIVVHVAGKVRSPGVQALPVGSRVADAVAAAGGPRPGASLTTLNLARVLTDGEQIIVGEPPGQALSPPIGGTAAPGTAVAPVSLNSADQPTLESLPGVGPVTASAIIAHREQQGPFTSVEQLLDVQGIGEATLAELTPLVTL